MAGDGSEGPSGKVGKEKTQWKKLIADVSVILGKFPRDVARNVTLFQAVEVLDSRYRKMQFEAGVHGCEMPDKDAPRTEDGRIISCLDDVIGIAGGMG